MSHIHKGILGAVAIALTCGASQFAAGEDLTVGMRSAQAPEQGVNRAAKTDRGAIVTEPVAPTKTVSFHVDRLPETSIVVRIPASHEARGSAASAPVKLKSGASKPDAACEPVVSVLTDIAKHLQPGRCIT
jgi:hypothetical protein